MKQLLRLAPPWSGEAMGFGLMVQYKVNGGGGTLYFRTLPFPGPFFCLSAPSRSRAIASWSTLRQ